MSQIMGNSYIPLVLRNTDVVIAQMLPVSAKILTDLTVDDPPNFVGFWVMKQRFHMLTLGTSRILFILVLR